MSTNAKTLAEQRRDRAKKTLISILRFLYTKSGAEWSADLRADAEMLIDDIVNSAVEEAVMDAMRQIEFFRMYKGGKFMEIVKMPVMVYLVDIGEGASGEYDPDDPNDTPLLRFGIDRFDGSEWVEVPDASYCTQLPLNITEEEFGKALSIIMDRVFDKVANGQSVKKVCEELSWMDRGWLKGA